MMIDKRLINTVADSKKWIGITVLHSDILAKMELMANLVSLLRLIYKKKKLKLFTKSYKMTINV